MMPPPPRVIGIDPGTRRLGFGVVELNGTRLIPLAHGVIDVASISPFPARLAKLHQELGRVIEEFHPVAAAVEEVFAGRNPKSALRAAEGRGAVLLTLQLAGLEIYQYAPTEIKRAITGRGQGSKEQVQQMVTTLLSLRTTPAQDAADALAAAICHLHRSAAPPAN